MIPIPPRPLLVPALSLSLAVALIATGRADDREERLRFALQIARERNDPALVAAVEAVIRSQRAGEAADRVESALRAAELSVGIDPGGWSMAGQPVFRPSAELARTAAEARRGLAAAMEGGDPAAVRAVVAEWIGRLGDQAGVPDGRRPGRRPASAPLDEAGATDRFLEALASEGRAVDRLTAGEGLPDQMLRFDAQVLEAVVAIHPFAQRHRPETLGRLDALARGVAGRLVERQEAAGHFPFPDLRGRNLRFGAMIERQLAAGRAEVRDGWVVTPDPDGGTQFDTGRCGVALLRAGRHYREEAWVAAGLRAAEWARSQPCVPNFNYNAFSVSLLAEAYRATGEARHLDAALAKFRLGVAPGQAPNGRWVDPHNARTVYHVILLRSLADLLAALPEDRAAERAEVAAVARPGLDALFDEFDAMGVTAECLPELLAFRPVFPGEARLREAIRLVAASLAEQSAEGSRSVMGAPPDQLAAAARAAAEVP